MMRTPSLVSPRLRAFSLPELLVVLVIIGILVLIALPNLMPLISRAKADGSAAAADVPSHVAEEQFLYIFPLFGLARGTWLRTAGARHRRRPGQLPDRDRRGHGTRASGPRPRQSSISTGTGRTTSGRSTRTRN